MKYRKIYQTLENRNAKIILDQSGWRGCGPAAGMTCQQPLWLMAELPGKGLRLWIQHQFGTFSLTTAYMTPGMEGLSGSSAQKALRFRSQQKLAVHLDALLRTGAGSTA